MHQFEMFMRAIQLLKHKGITFEIRHCCNSAGIMRYPDMHLDMVRPGIILYGLAPSDELNGYWNLKPVMSLRSVVSMVKRSQQVLPQVMDVLLLLQEILY